ncbi:putative leucoanthocyanidin reductase [Helianthus annuus]|uniref:Leucoanthocyanidin reductase n=1 Tax=Helianthus annuus TaxID=4232 RepID=A0A251VF67_HELAN|nr:leucoanthocyanidin reductase isoform X1 [Helianthus annuus]KAF5764062.1 putative leucoanthocyanidin reductase [Helianthus annuus]KAJ0830803.1 putative leucoanthocyanidin reductase [Helianthus annuus]
MVATPSTERTSHVLIIGASGFMGHFIAQASLDSGQTTYVLTRSSSALSSSKIKALHDNGAIILHRFLPSEFGHDVDRADPVEPGLSMYKEKRRVRQLVEESGIPYTYICCNSIASWPYHDNIHPSDALPPLDHFDIYGDGSIKAYFVAGSDIGKFTMKTINDTRTVNKVVHFRPLVNHLNINELACLWEKKIQRTLPRRIVSESDLLKAASENIIPQSIVAAFTHDIFFRGCQTFFSVSGTKDVEIGDLYPDECFRTMDECFEEFLMKLKEKPVEGS